MRNLKSQKIKLNLIVYTNELFITEPFIETLLVKKSFQKILSQMEKRQKSLLSLYIKGGFETSCFRFI